MNYNVRYDPVFILRCWDVNITVKYRLWSHVNFRVLSWYPICQYCTVKFTLFTVWVIFHNMLFESLLDLIWSYDLFGRGAVSGGYSVRGEDVCSRVCVGGGVGWNVSGFLIEIDSLALPMVTVMAGIPQWCLYFLSRTVRGRSISLFAPRPGGHPLWLICNINQSKYFILGTHCLYMYRTTCKSSQIIRQYYINM